MPIYEYACGDCGHKFEALVRSGTAPQCPHCHSTELEKLLSVFSTTAASSSATPVMPSPCGSCEHRGTAGGCAMN
ncbi:MAG: FmdB family zinc ribbon protein [Rhodoferax sp.]